MPSGAAGRPLDSKRVSGIVLLILAAWLGGISWWGGGSRAGWQLEEDYEIFEIRDSLAAGRSPVLVAAQYMLEDHHRIRTYYWVRTLQAWVFGNNIRLFRLSLLFLGLVTVFLFYRWALRCGLGRIASILLPMLLFGADRMGIWWRMGTAENLGMFFLSLALSAGCRASRSHTPRRWDALFVVFAALMIFSKESFIVSAPAVVFLKVWEEAVPARRGWSAAMRRNWPVAVLSCLLAVTALAMILIWTGTTVGGYAGVDGFEVKKWLTAMAGPVRASGVGFVAGILGLTALAAYRHRKVRSLSVRSMIPGAVFAALLLVPLGVLFQKTGMNNHYVLPGTLSIVFIVMLAFKYLNQSGSKLLAAAALALLAGQATLNSGGAFEASRVFWERSEKVRRAVESVQRQTRPEDIIVAVADPPRQIEHARAMKIYWERLADRKNLYFSPIIRPNLGPLEKYLTYDHPVSALKVFEGRLLNVSSPGYPQADLIVCYPYNDFWFLMRSQTWFKRPDYERRVTDGFVTYRRRESGA